MTPVWPAGDPRDVARTILASPRFRVAPAKTGPPGPTLFERLWTWIGERLDALFRGIGHVLGGNTTIAQIVTLAVFAVVAIGAGFLVVWFFRLPSRKHVVVRRPIRALDRALTSDELRARARASAREERWHDAASALVRAALYALDERGRLRFRASRTAGEARRIVRDPDFDVIASEAATALFADAGATAAGYARMDAAYERAFGSAQ